MNYKILNTGDFYITQGIEPIIGKEFRIKNGNYTELEIQDVVNYIAGYIVEEKKTIKHEESFEFGSWLLQFRINESYIDVCELKNISNGENIYDEGVDITLEIYRMQSSLIKDGMSPQIPRFSQKIALSREIYDGSEINGVRYPAPQHMTGWYLTSNSYNGDVSTLIVDYLYFIIKKRFDIIKFLALPAGYRFYKDNEEEGFWFDDQVK